jgi:hypothetical protein
MLSSWLRESSAVPRSELVSRLADHLSRTNAPRLQLMTILVVAAAAGFLSSVLLLWSSVDAFDRMPLRYALAALCAYAVFIGLIRLWIALHRPATRIDVEPDLADALDVAADLLPSGTSQPGTASVFTGGRGGGGGASSQWSSGIAGHSNSGGRSSWGIDLDLDEGIWLVVAAVCAAAGLAAVAYVVYMAPVLLAEVALDAAIVSALYRRLRRDEHGYWLTTVLRRTWVPAAILVVFAFLTGFALQQAAPQARSIGAVIQSVTGSSEAPPQTIKAPPR